MRFQYQFRLKTGISHGLRGIPKVFLRLALRDHNNNPVSDTACTLMLKGEELDLTTDSDGLLETELNEGTNEGRLRLDDIEIPLQIQPLAEPDTTEGIQARLNNIGIDVGDIDGKPGPRTRLGIEEFQCENDLTVSGEADPATVDKLREVHGC